MPTVTEWFIRDTNDEARHVTEWANPGAEWIALLSHGYGEHIGRYDALAAALCKAGAVVLGPDHRGHGRSDGERALIGDFEAVVDDLQSVARQARRNHPGLPTVLIGHSMGGMVAGRYGQRYGAELSALVLSGPMFGSREALVKLSLMNPIPESPIDPGALSRDPAVGNAYIEDPLVWHGGLKKPTIQAMITAMDAVESGPSLDRLPLLWIHGASDPLVPMAGTRPMIEHLRGDVYEERIYPGAMHEVFNETNRDEVIRDVIDFVRKALARRP